MLLQILASYFPFRMPSLYTIYSYFVKNYSRSQYIKPTPLGGDQGRRVLPDERMEGLIGPSCTARHANHYVPISVKPNSQAMAAWPRMRLPGNIPDPFIQSNIGLNIKSLRVCSCSKMPRYPRRNILRVFRETRAAAARIGGAAVLDFA